jgi:hypothetical protein
MDDSDFFQNKGEDMMRLLLAMALLTFSLTLSLLACNHHDMTAAVAENGPPARGDVDKSDSKAAGHAMPFPHKPHADIIACSLCHKGAGKPVIDRTMGHQLCRDCHTKEGAGPVACADCHRP